MRRVRCQNFSKVCRRYNFREFNNFQGGSYTPPARETFPDNDKGKIPKKILNFFFYESEIYETSIKKSST